MLFFTSWLPYSADTYDLDLSVVFHDKYTAGTSANFLRLFHLCLWGIKVELMFLMNSNERSKFKSRWFWSLSFLLWSGTLAGGWMAPCISCLPPCQPGTPLRQVPTSLSTCLPTSLSTLTTSYQFTLSRTPPCWLSVNSFSPSCQPCTTAAPNFSSKTDPEK